MRAIQEAYLGILFPYCFFRFHDFVEDLKTAHGIDINRCALQIQLGDAFQVFQPAPDPKSFDPLTTSRYPNDPPEFFTVLHGPSDGLHWGYYFEDPGQPEYFVASYFHNEPLQFSIDGQNLMEAARKFLEQCYEDNKEYLEIHGEEVYVKELEELALIRSVLRNYGTGEREEIGNEYVEKYEYTRQVTAPTRDGLGIVVGEHLYSPLPDADYFLNPDFTPTPEQVDRYMKEASEKLAEGLPGAALKLGKDLWCYARYKGESFRMLELAYGALNRDTSLALLNIARKQTAAGEAAE